MPTRRPPAERFWEKVVKTDTCWVWTAATTADGYGHLSVTRRMTYAHRFAYELLVGPIPEGLTIDHLCRVRSCVRPSHLEAVSRGENVLRGDGLPAKNARKTHCIHGHEFSAENTLITSSGHRACRTCRRMEKRKAKREALSERAA